MDNARLASLTGLYIAGVLSADECVELYGLLLSSPAAREQFDRQVEAHAINDPTVSLLSATQFLEAYVPCADSTPLRREGKSRHLGFYGRQRTAFARLSSIAGRSRYGRTGAAMAACLVVALAGLVLYQRTEPLPRYEVSANLSTQSLATLRHAAHVQWLDATNEIFIGDTFGAGELRVAAGVFELQFKRGAQLVVEGPARLQLISEMEAFLHSGKVTAHVPEGAQGFKVTTPTVAVTDLGTEFGVRADAKLPAEVHVFSGLVEMARPTLEARRMAQGEAARLRGRTIRKISSDRTAFIFADELLDLEAVEQLQRYETWRNAANTLSSDPTAVVHFTFEEQSEMGGRLVNAASSPTRSAAGTINATWDAGRWPLKRGVTFTSKANRIRFSVPNMLTSLTYMAWLRVDNLTSVSNALAITESGQLGEVHWQIYRDGRVALSARSGRSGSVDDTWDRGLSPAIFTPDRLGKWTHLTSVYDSQARTINHYVNGEFVSATHIKRPLPLKLGAVEIANWGPRADAQRNGNPDYYSRHWNGCLDEFALLSRAMSAEEIRRYYQAGRVAVGMMMTQRQP